MRLGKSARSFGIQGLPVPTEYGGLGMDPLTTVAALERLGYACKDNGLLFSINAHLWTAVTPLVYNGSEAQKKKYLPGLCNGTLIGGNAMSEPNSGSDAFSLTPTAIKKGPDTSSTVAKSSSPMVPSPTCWSCLPRWTKRAARTESPRSWLKKIRQE
jgi:alkylation response protein AidB-like acyl-CoA dehydrogenase